MRRGTPGDPEDPPNNLRWGVIGFIVLIAVVAAVKYAPSETPRTLPNQPVQTVSSAEPGSTVLGTRPERSPHKPASQGTTIYVVAPKLNPVWGLDSALAGWKKARWTDFRKVAVCPVARPCVTIAEKNLGKTEAGQTNFSDRAEDTTIYLNSILIWEPFKAQSTLAHEFGHVLGAPHVIGTNNTIMTAKDGFYRTQPTDLDIRLVDQLGRWELEKMYVESGKTVDVSDLPK